jgi:hypothetical protein
MSPSYGSSISGSTRGPASGSWSPALTYQGWDVQITAYTARDWRANFFPVGITHSIVDGTAQEPTPWQAVQRAAWEALNAAAARMGIPARSWIGL